MVGTEVLTPNEMGMSPTPFGAILNFSFSANISSDTTSLLNLRRRLLSFLCLSCTLSSLFLVKQSFHEK
jgi:hypothetical protein